MQIKLSFPSSQIVTKRTLKEAWNNMLGEFKERADWHLSISEMMKKAVCDPLFALEKQLRKDHKAIQAPVEKALKTLYEVNGLVSKVSFTISSP